MTGAENEAVAVEPAAVGRVALEGFTKEDRPDFGGPEREPEVTGRALVHGVHGETTGFIGGFGEDGVVHGTLESGRWRKWLKSDGSGRESTDGESVSGETPPEGKRPSLRERRMLVQGECAGGGDGAALVKNFTNSPCRSRGGEGYVEFPDAGSTSAMTIPPELLARIDEAITHYPVSKRSAVLPVLHLLQHHFGFIQEEAIPWVAQKLGLENIQVAEVVTFYPGFRQSAPGKYHIRVCRTLSCAMAGSAELMEKLCEHAGIDRSHTDHHHPIAVSKDGKFSIEFAECLASCGFGPVCMVNDDFHEAIAPDKAAALLDRYRAKA